MLRMTQSCIIKYPPTANTTPLAPVPAPSITRPDNVMASNGPALIVMLLPPETGTIPASTPLGLVMLTALVDRSEASAVDGCDLAAWVHNIDGLLKCLARRPESTRIAVVAVGRDKRPGTGIGRNGEQRTGQGGC